MLTESPVIGYVGCRLEDHFYSAFVDYYNRYSSYNKTAGYSSEVYHVASANRWVGDRDSRLHRFQEEVQRKAAAAVVTVVVVAAVVAEAVAAEAAPEVAVDSVDMFGSAEASESVGAAPVRNFGS